MPVSRIIGLATEGSETPLFGFSLTLSVRPRSGFGRGVCGPLEAATVVCPGSVCRASEKRRCCVGETGRAGEGGGGDRCEPPTRCLARLYKQISQETVDRSVARPTISPQFDMMFDVSVAVVKSMNERSMSSRSKSQINYARLRHKALVGGSVPPSFPPIPPRFATFVHHRIVLSVCFSAEAPKAPCTRAQLLQRSSRRIGKRR